MQNNNSGMPAHFFLIKKKHGLKLPLCSMKASHHKDMGHLRCRSFILGKNVAVCIELSGSVREERLKCSLAKN